jgi:hypothetical protein
VADQQPLLQSVSLVDQAALGCGLVFFVIGGIVRYRRHGLAAADLGALLGLAVAAFAIPKGLFLVYCAFRPDLLIQVKDLPQQLAVAGLCAVFLAVVAIKAGLEKGPGDAPPSS